MTWSSLTLWLVLGSLLFPHVSAQSTSCDRGCNSNNDCSDKLICVNKLCTDDPNAATKVCGTPGGNVAGSCNKICNDHSNCPGQLACMANKCTDDPFMPTQICGINNSCKVQCRTLDNCPGQLICIDEECNDDPDVGTHICDGGAGVTAAAMAPGPGGMGNCNETTPCSNMAYSSRTFLISGREGAWNSVAWFFLRPALGLWLLFL